MDKTKSNQRRSGKTTRIIDAAIQQLYTIGIAIYPDQNERRTAEKIQCRLDAEHQESQKVIWHSSIDFSWLVNAAAGTWERAAFDLIESDDTKPSDYKSLSYTVIFFEDKFKNE